LIQRNQQRRFSITNKQFPHGQNNEQQQQRQWQSSNGNQAKNDEDKKVAAEPAAKATSSGVKTKTKQDKKKHLDLSVVGIKAVADAKPSPASGSWQQGKQENPLVLHCKG
jgi:hypothetical protein